MGDETRIRKNQIEDEPFDGTTGHTHSGVDGQGPVVSGGASTLDGLTDVNVPSPSDGQVLTYDDGSSQWTAQDSSGGSGGALSPRGTDSLTTSSLIQNQADSGKTLGLGKCCAVTRLSTNRPAWVRVYSSSAYQSADASREQTEDPTGEHGVLLECITTAANLILDLCPAALVFSSDGYGLDTVPVTVTNLDSSTGTVIVELTYIRFEG